jgi:hypothetical protein
MLGRDGKALDQIKAGRVGKESPVSFRSKVCHRLATTGGALLRLRMRGLSTTLAEVGFSYCRAE